MSCFLRSHANYNGWMDGWTTCVISSEQICHGYASSTHEIWFPCDGSRYRDPLSLKAPHMEHRQSLHLFSTMPCHALFPSEIIHSLIHSRPSTGPVPRSSLVSPSSPARLAACYSRSNARSQSPAGRRSGPVRCAPVARARRGSAGRRRS